MRTILFAVITLLLSTPLLAQELPGWEKVYETDSDFTYPKGWFQQWFPSQMSFPTSNVGYCVIAPDTLLITMDKGVTWRKEQVRFSDSMKVLRIDNISFYGESEGFISAVVDTNVTYKGNQILCLIKISDYASKFKLIPIPGDPYYIYSIHFFNPNYGVCTIKYHKVASGSSEEDTAASIVTTFDGGTTWSGDLDVEPISWLLKGDGRILQVMDSLTWYNEYGVGSTGVTYKYKLTADGGKTWTENKHFAPTYALALRMNYIYDMHSKRYYDESLKQYVYSRIYYATENQYFDSLPKQFIGNTPAYSFCQNGFVVMYGGNSYDGLYNRYLYTTTDSCKTWTMNKISGWEQYSSAYSAYAISAVTTNDGWAFLLCKFEDSASNSKGVIYRKHLNTNTGINEVEKPKITIYPNPTEQILRWNIPDGRVTITDALGLEVVSIPASSMEADVSGLAIGVYYLTIRSGGESVTRMFTVMR